MTETLPRAMPPSSAGLALLAAADPPDSGSPGSGAADSGAARAGGRWRVRAIRAGMAEGGVFYPDDTLRRAAPLFDGARVFARSDEDHLADRARDARNIVGRIERPEFVAAAGGAPAEVRADLALVQPDGPVGRLLAAAAARGMTELMGLSLCARGRVRAEAAPGGAYALAVREIERVDSVDLVARPAAGGALIALVEAVRDSARAETEGNAMNENPNTKANAGAGADSNSDSGAALEAAAERARAAALAAARAEARIRVAAAPLPEAARTRLAARLDSAPEAELAPEAVDRAVADERAYLAAAAPGGQVAGLGAPAAPAGAVRAGDRAAKVRRMWDAFFDPADRSQVSLREAYVETTGDRRVTGMLRDCDGAALREAVTTTGIAEVLGDSMSRRMLADYRETGIYDGWRRWCATAALTDFREQKRVRWGGYANMPKVAEGAAYAAQATPSDEEETYAPAKYGGLETVTLEAIRNDDAMALQRLPRMLARACKRTLSAFAAGFLTDVSAASDMADGVRLFHATHKNLGSAALSSASLAAARLAMMKQAEPTGGKPLGIGPKCLIVPFDLEETAANLFRRSTENDRTFVQSLALEVVPQPEFTDADDWFLAADPMDIPTVEIGFLDGREEPEVLTQDHPTSGSLFTNDRITYKVRHVYGGAAMDWRGLYKAKVG